MLTTPGEKSGVQKTGRKIMIILQEALLITSAPDDIQMVLGAFFVIAALVLFSLSVEVGMYPSVRNWTGTFLTADYWLRRHKRRSFAWTLATDRPAFSS